MTLISKEVAQGKVKDYESKLERNSDKSYPRILSSAIKYSDTYKFQFLQDFIQNQPINWESDTRVSQQLNKLKTHKLSYFHPIIEFYLKHEDSYYISQFLKTDFLDCKSDDDKIEKLFEFALFLQQYNFDKSIHDDYMSSIKSDLLFLLIPMAIIGGFSWVILASFFFTALAVQAGISAGLAAPLLLGSIIAGGLLWGGFCALIACTVEKYKSSPEEIDHFRDSIAKHQKSLGEIEKRTKITDSGIEMTTSPFAKM